jgi:hypothetical protein
VIMAIKNDKMRGHAGKNWSKSVDMRSGGVYDKTSKKPEPDDKPARTPKERNTGTTVAKRLAGKVIG